MAETRILIVDDHAILRAGLRLLLDAQPDLAVVGEAGDALHGVDLARALQPDVVLLDITMPGQGGLDTLPAMRRASSTALAKPAPSATAYCARPACTPSSRE